MRENQPTEPDGSPVELPDELNEFARRLSGFQPGASTLNRERLMFEAGRAAALAEVGRAETHSLPSPSLLRRWQMAAMVMTTVSLALATTMALRSESEPRVVIVERMIEPKRIDVPAPQSKNLAAELPIADERSTDPVNVAERNVTDRMATDGRFTPTDELTRPRSVGWLGIPLRQARELALAHGLDPEDFRGRSRSVPDDSNDISVYREPPLSPLSLMGDKPRLSIDRLLEEPPL